ncbi:SDR family oxidoreductase [Curtobacterium sp. MCPF17_002]|uniref:SDR family NAD(P)-dependent oxidoreductase n=1 Tax=Curtobacterium sp. MCPF17_002 TaxID=2175645 RepID=UPI0015E88304|nr:SDR family oxidoreductase [Curtobacterium sp. MCPF17_002]WIB77733.1 SDR family oxidoreductase [Curtobacterium sp. MCPF17_002]
MTTISAHTRLSGRRVLVPGGTGGVGEGVVRAFLDAGADVVVPTRSDARGAELRDALGALGHSPLLHLPTHDYTSFAGAEALGQEMTERMGGIDDVVAPVGGWWQGRTLTEITDADWSTAFTDLATTHMALARAIVPRLSGAGAYTVVVGQSAEYPVPGSGLVSMEQAAVLMMQRVLAAEEPDKRIHAMVLGPVRTRSAGTEDWVSSDDIGAVAVATSTAETFTSRTITLATPDDAKSLLASLVTPVAAAGR